MEIGIKNGYIFYFIIFVLLYIFLSIYFLRSAIKEKNTYKKVIMFISSALFILASILIICGILFDNIGVMIFGFITPLGLFLSLMSVELIVRYLKCNSLLIGEYCGLKFVNRYRGNETYSPVFSYSYNGRKYKTNSFCNYTKRKLEKKYKKGNEYEIYINPEHPEDVVSKDMFPFNIFITTIASLIFIIMGTSVLIAR